MSKFDIICAEGAAIKAAEAAKLESTRAAIAAEREKQAAAIEEIYKILGQYKWHLMTPRECIEAIAAEIAKA